MSGFRLAGPSPHVPGMSKGACLLEAAPRSVPGVMPGSGGPPGMGLLCPGPRPSCWLDLTASRVSCPFHYVIVAAVMLWVLAGG